MSVIQGTTSIPAAGSTNNLLSGSAFEYARVRQLVSIGVTASATGTFIGITVGSELILEDTPTYILAAYPVVPDQMFYNASAQAGDRLVIRARNPTAGAIVFSYLVQITPY